MGEPARLGTAAAQPATGPTTRIDAAVAARAAARMGPPQGQQLPTPSQWGAPPPPRPRPDRSWYRREQIVTPLAILALVYLLGLVGLVARPPTPGGLLLGGATADRVC